MQNLTRGQKLKLSDLTPSTFFGVGLQTNAPGLVFDISCFGVDENNKLSDDRYFVFYNQKASPEGALRQMGPQGGDTETFAVNLAQLPAHIRRLVFAITIDGNGTMSQLQNGHVRIVVAGQEIARFAFAGRDFSTEKAIIAAEIYFKDVWRIAAVGQGFAGGLSALLKHYGGEEVAPGAATPAPPASNTPPGSVPPPAPRPSFAPPAPVNSPPPAAAPPASPYPPAPPRPNTPNNSAYSPPAAAPPPYAPPIPAPAIPPAAAPSYPTPSYPVSASPSVSTPTLAPPAALASANGSNGTGAPRPLNLNKITLDKQGEKSAVSLKKGGGVQPIHINLNWDNPNQGLYGGTNSIAPDLDLGCMFRLKNGMGSVIQPLGGNFGAREKEPFIFLDKDDRSGEAQDGENLYIYRPDLIESVMVFALIYQGAPNFMAVNARLTLQDQDGNEIFIRLNNPDREHAFCCICTIRNHGDHIEITKEERYVPGHREADQNFGFNFRWAAGSK